MISTRAYCLASRGVGMAASTIRRAGGATRRRSDRRHGALAQLQRAKSTLEDASGIAKKNPYYRPHPDTVVLGGLIVALAALLSSQLSSIKESLSSKIEGQDRKIDGAGPQNWRVGRQN